MYVLLTLFFASLAAIMIMLGRQIFLIRNGSVVLREDEYHPLGADIVKVKYIAKRGLRKYAYLALVGILRLYFRVVNEIRTGYNEAKAKIRETVMRKLGEENKNSEPREVSGFLKMIVEHKRKFRTLKHKIKEEEERESL